MRPGCPGCPGEFTMKIGSKGRKNAIFYAIVMEHLPFVDDNDDFRMINGLISGFFCRKTQYVLMEKSMVSC